MEFIVRRASNYFTSDERPVERAVFKSLDRIDIAPFSNAEAFDKIYFNREGSWFSKGVNHCINKKGCIQRTLLNNYEEWIIEINTIEDLIDIMDETKCEVILRSPSDEMLGEITIYDDYVE